MESSPDYSDSEDSVDSNNSSDGGGCPNPVVIRPKATDLGKRVIFSGNDKRQKYGVLRYVGEPEFAAGVWCGVELDQPTGKNNGSVHGIRYFTCEANCGMFVPVMKVELDTSNRRSRSRPNSQPSSRASSVERKERPSSATAKSNTAPPIKTTPTPKMGLGNMQHELTNRLSQPFKRQAHTPSNTSNKRQPMKAFATKGQDLTLPRQSKKTLAPFRAGGMHKAASTENIRSLKDKSKTSSNTHKVGGSNQGMPAKKSSSERDLRKSAAGTAKPQGNGVPGGTAKPKHKPVRTSSCSDLIAPGPPKQQQKQQHQQEANCSKSSATSSSTTSSTSHTSLDNYLWPRTSTPGDRNELTPDGCSSPEESMDGGKERLSVSTCNKAFIEEPSPSLAPAQSKSSSKAGSNLATQVKQFTEAELSSPSLPHLSVQSPDQAPPQKLFYKNRLSGTATLHHPLAQAIINKEASQLSQLFGPNQSVSAR